MKQDIYINKRILKYMSMSNSTFCSGITDAKTERTRQVLSDTFNIQL